MTTQEARFILQSCRHHGGDASDPHFQEALEHARHDPELAKWFAEETKLDAAISRKLKAVSIPEDLRASILAARKIETPTFWQRRNVLMAVAACVAILALLAVTLSFGRSKNDFAVYRGDMTEFLTTKLDRLDLKSSDMSTVKDWLANRRAPHDFALPDGIKDLPGLGCRIVEWRGKKVTLVCFKENGTKEVHMFVADRAGFRDVPPEGSPQFQQSGNWMTASWSHGDKVYLVAGIGDRTKLEKFL